jgi:hypothetical protein
MIPSILQTGTVERGNVNGNNISTISLLPLSAAI